MIVSVLSVFLQPCIALFSLMAFITEVDVQAEPTSPSEVSLEVTKAPAFPFPCKFPPPPANSGAPSFPPSTSPWELPDDDFALLSSAPARAMSVPPALQAAPQDYTTHKPPLSAPATGPDALTSWAQSQWIAFNDTFVPCRGPAHQAARPRSVPLSQQPKLLSRGPAIDCFASTGREESTPNLRDTTARGVQDGKFCGMRSMFKYTFKTPEVLLCKENILFVYCILILLVCFVYLILQFFLFFK